MILARRRLLGEVGFSFVLRITFNEFLDDRLDVLAPASGAEVNLTAG